MKALALLGICLAAQGKSALPSAAKGLRIHEWGVFHIEKAGCKATGGGEAPTFIQRVETKLPQLSPDPEFNTEAKEPILHIYAPEAMPLHVEVSFPDSRPTLAWPKAQAARKGSTPCLSWDLQVAGRVQEKQPEADPLPKVPEEHWISTVRKVGSNLVRSGKDAERFLFYEGELTYQSICHASSSKQPNRVTCWGTGVREAWVLRGGEKSLRNAHVTQVPPPMRCDMGAPACREWELEESSGEALQAELSKTLVAEGLSKEEAGALLTIWIPELTKPGLRLVYVLPRAEYDRLLPIRFCPQPEELQRVGLVVQEISP